MTIVVRRHSILGDIQAEIVRLESLLADLRHVADGHLPTEANISSAPIIDRWATATRPEVCLIGEVHGHPNCAGPMSVTSGLQIFSPEYGWARTGSRFFRLGNWLTDGQGLPQ
jgi:hypothetical protein